MVFSGRKKGFEYGGNFEEAKRRKSNCQSSKRKQEKERKGDSSQMQRKVCVANQAKGLKECSVCCKMLYCAWGKAACRIDGKLHC